MTSVCNAEFSVGGVSSAITVREIVDDDLHDLRSAEGSGRGEVVRAQRRNLSDLIEPGEVGDFGNFQRFCRESRIGDGGRSRRDLSDVEWAEEDLIKRNVRPCGRYLKSNERTL